MKKRTKFAAAGFCTALLSAMLPVNAAAFDNTVSSDTDVWPDIYEYSEKYAIMEVETEPETEETTSLYLYVTLKDHPYTEEELTSLFGDLPQYLESGSFLLNRLNRNPYYKISIDDMNVYINDKYVPVRAPWEALTETISSKLDEYEGDWSVYIKDLTSGKTMEINEHHMESASLIKLFIAGTIYEKLEDGTLTEDDRMTNALHDMIVYSDNESSNVLVRYLYDAEAGEDFQDGLAVVNDFIQRHGFTNTEQVNGIADPSLWVSDGRVNQTSAADCGRLLEMIYKGELVSHFSSFRFETLLNKQQVNYKIPGGLPEGTHISHKTGEVDDVESDAGIIYTPNGDYIFCILSNNLTDPDAAVGHIHEITALVYDYFITPAFELPTITEEIVDHATLIEVADAE